MADPTPTLYGKRLLDTDSVLVTDIPDETITGAKLADDCIDDDRVIAAFTIGPGKLATGALSSYLMLAEGVVYGYHHDINANVVSGSRDIADTDQGDLLVCSGSPTVTVVGTIATSGATGWQNGQTCLIMNADSGTLTIAAGSGQTLTARNGTTLTGTGAVGLLMRVGTNSWTFTALAGGVGHARVARKTADEAITSDSTLTSDTDLTLTVAASCKYAVEACLIYASEATPDFKAGFSGPSGATMWWAPAVTTTPSSTALSISGSAVAGGAGGSPDRVLTMVGTLEVDATAGSLAVQWAQNTSDGATTTLREGSWLKLTRLP